MAVPLFNLAPNLTDSKSDSLALPLILKYKFIRCRDDDFRRAKTRFRSRLASSTKFSFPASISSTLQKCIQWFSEPRLRVRGGARSVVLATKVPSGQMTWLLDGPKCLNAKNITEAIDGRFAKANSL
ncbi:hypothetical protein ACE6H2_012027 [Prunus campanulata]